MVNKLGTKWKKIHRFVYLVILLITIHALLLGSQFVSLNSFATQICFAALALLLFLETIRLDKYLRRKFSFIPQFGISLGVFLMVFAASSIIIFLPAGSDLSLNVHAAHIALAQSAQSGQTLSNLPAIPGLTGDRTRRYTASFSEDGSLDPGKDITLKFKVYDASSGNPINLFGILYAYPMHLMIVDSTLSTFEHIHPTLTGNEFAITTQFPKPGLYHLYIQFQPVGGIEQQMAFTIPIGVNPTDQPAASTQKVDTNLTKVFGDYEVTLNTNGELQATAMTLGRDKLSFTIKDAKTKAPITTLKPFMASFGHLTMINETTYDFIHVHPNSLTIPPPDANGGPTVDFLPIGIYGPFKSGIYRAFGEFSTKVGTDFDVDFTVEVK